MQVGTISELWQYPVKSMAGEQVEQARFDRYGMIGDRAWAMLHDDSGDIAWGKSTPALMNLVARYCSSHPEQRVYAADVPGVSVLLPDGNRVEGDALNAAVSDYTGTALKLSALQPPDRREHYQWKTPVGEAEIMKILGIGPDDPIPDMSVYDQSMLELLSAHFAPPGTYHDMYPVHMLTTASLSQMRESSGADYDPRRFRPSFVVETAEGVEGFAEFDWQGKNLSIGEVVLRVEVKTVRCSMPSRDQAPYNLPRNPDIARSLNKASGRFFGIYLSVEQDGRIRRGDAVVLGD